MDYFGLATSTQELEASLSGIARSAVEKTLMTVANLRRVARAAADALCTGAGMSVFRWPSMAIAEDGKV